MDSGLIYPHYTCAGVTEDILTWAPKSRDGGTLMGYDVKHDNFSSVTQAVDELLPGWKLREDKVWFIPVNKVSAGLGGDGAT